MHRAILALFPLTAAIAVAATAQSGASFTVTETGQEFARLSDAIDAIGDRQGTVLIAPGTYSECAVQQAGYNSFKAEVPGRTIFD
ncbi:MAG: right-handed parallel beta-helix repeat-containing protein, partial [Sphingomonadales bacterium]